MTFFLNDVQDRLIHVSEILPLRTIQVNKGKFTLEIGPLNGSHALNTHARFDSKRLKWQRIPTAVDSWQIDLNQYWHKNKMILD